MIVEYDIEPIAKPRMTQSDRWRRRPAILKYWSFKKLCRLKGVTLPESDYHITFILPMPKSWSKKKKAEFDGQPHQQVPDKDNLEKALLDALYDDDSHIWDGRVSKRWGKVGKIIVCT